MEKIGRGSSFAIALAAMALATLCASARASDEAPPKHGASLGLATQRISDSWREKNAYRASGVLVIGVDPAGRAAKGGIATGDVLVSVDGRTLREPSDLGYAERNIQADEPVAIVIARDGGHSIKMFDIAPTTDAGPGASAAAVSATATSASPPSTPDPASSEPVGTVVIPEAAPTGSSVVIDAAPSDPKSVEPAPALIVARSDTGTAPVASAVPSSTATTGASAANAKTGAAELGVRGQTLTPDLATALLGAEGVEGVLVLEVGKESPADHAGLRPGDIIFKIGDQDVKDEATLDQAVVAASNPAAISMLRRGDQQMVLAPLEGHPGPASLATTASATSASQDQVINELKGEVASLKKELADLKEQIAKLIADSAKPKQ